MKYFSSFLTEFNISLQYHDTLNPKLWKDEKLDPDVRAALILFAKTWARFADIPPSLIQDIIMLGGNTNYNYTDMSDIDVHVLIDRSQLGSNKRLVDDYLQVKKTLWTLTHDITVKGYPLEPYAQDITAPFQKGQGVYSLLNDKWIQKPIHGSYNFASDKHLKHKVKQYMHMIDHMIKFKSSVEEFKDLRDKLKDMRSSGIEKGGEFSFENLVFKELRNKGYLDKMNAYEKNVLDSELSIK